MEMDKPVVLVVADYYLPGFRAGGPIRGIANTVRELSADARFFVVTRNHDSGGPRYTGVVSDAWTAGEFCEVYYASRLGLSSIAKTIADVSPDVIWLNSVFSRAAVKTLLHQRLRGLGSRVVMSP